MQSLSLRVVDNKTGTDVSIIINEQPLQLATLTNFDEVPAISSSAEFVKIGADARALPDSATDHAVVYVRSRNIWITARKISNKRLSWKAAEAACAKLDLCGFKDWRLPDLQDLEAIRDLTRVSPAVNTDLFPELDSSAHWSRTEYAGGASSGAWYVNFHLGYSHPYDRGDECFVLAVRSGGLPGQ